jgi:hypothetical protein
MNHQQVQLERDRDSHRGGLSGRGIRGDDHLTEQRRRAGPPRSKARTSVRLREPR